MLRSHTCGQLNAKNVGETVVLYGWARAIRQHKDIIFINLTDRYGWTQICADKDQCQNLPRESFVKVTGRVIPRPQGNINKDIATGEIEVECQTLELVAPSRPIPFEIVDNEEAREEVRLNYRFLDLRRPCMVSHLLTRNKIASSIRKTLEAMEFMEVETPMFVRSTPEGSRDFLVPSRTYPGTFYALPQSPQLYKQMLMIAGIDRYYQFARCYRDEDARRERQLVHTQVDLEMALATQEDIFTVVEKIMVAAYRDVFAIEVPAPFPRYSYEEVMRHWGTDKPDLRFGMELIDFSAALDASGFALFDNAIAAGQVVKGLVAPGAAGYSRAQIKELEKFVQTFDLKGLVSFKVQQGQLQGSAVKKMTGASSQKLLESSGAGDNDLLLLAVGESTVVHRGLGELRRKLGKQLQLIDPKQICFLWVKDFPLFEWDPQQQNWMPMHHMFTMPNEQYIPTLEQNPGQVTGQLYDLVLNGVELGSGSIRVTLPDLQERIMKIIGMSQEQAHKRFGFLLEAYQYASPSHCGIGIGFDNLVMTFLGLENIREVIAFPNASSGMFLYDGSPTSVDPEQLAELHIELRLPQSAAPADQESV